MKTENKDFIGMKKDKDGVHYYFIKGGTHELKRKFKKFSENLTDETSKQRLMKYACAGKRLTSSVSGKRIVEDFLLLPNGDLIIKNRFESDS